ncbi:hypothetical protein PSCICN_31290 [Pseudomonas cichorii]|nr:hypothetical protein PSCICN_31290 [Pseudomonas cichorii]
MAAHKADVDAVDVIDDEHHHEQRQHMTFDFGRCPGKHIGISGALEALQDTTPVHCFFRDESIMDAVIDPV